MPHLSKLPLKDWSEKKIGVGCFLVSSIPLSHLQAALNWGRLSSQTGALSQQNVHAGHLCNTSPCVLWMPQHCWAVTSLFHRAAASWCPVKQVLSSFSTISFVQMTYSLLHVTVGYGCSLEYQAFILTVSLRLRILKTLNSAILVLNWIPWPDNSSLCKSQMDAWSWCSNPWQTQGGSFIKRLIQLFSWLSSHPFIPLKIKSPPLLTAFPAKVQLLWC